jgi:hypothetical protein
MRVRRRVGLIAKNEEDRAQQTKPGPEIVPGDLLPHVKNGERDEHREGNDFLSDFELRKAEDRVPDPIGRDLQEVFKEGDPPAYQRCCDPRLFVHVFEMTIPGEGHEDVGEREQDHRRDHWGKGE